MILRDYKCPVHGFFESSSTEPVCPHGCDAGIMQVFLKAPSISTGVVKAMDERMDQMSKRFNMSDLRGNVHEGEAQKQAPQGDFAPRFTPLSSASLGRLSRSDAIDISAASAAFGGSRGLLQRTHITAKADE